MSTTTQTQAAAALKAVTDQLKENAADIIALQAKVDALTSDKATLTAALATAGTDTAAAVAAKATAEADLATAQAALAAATATNNSLLVQIAELQSTLTTVTETSAELQAAIDDLVAQAKAIATLFGTPVVVVDPPVTPPPTTDDAAILAEVSDNTAAGIDRRLGTKGDASLVFPAVWERPQAPAPDLGWKDGAAYMGKFSQGLSVATTPPAPPAERLKFDFGSTDLNVGIIPDGEFDPVAVKNTGFVRLRSEEHSGGAVQTAPVPPWVGGPMDPDRDSANHVQYNLHEKLGRVVAAAYGKSNRYDARPGLYSAERGQGFWGMLGTATAFPTWAGAALPVDFVPMCITVTSKNEFVIVGGYNKTTGRGQFGIYWMGSGQDLQGRQNPGHNLPFDWPVTYPGLMNSGMLTFTKLFGFFDLPIKWPTNIDCVVTPGVNSRIQGPDGNASYLNIWPLGTDAQRAAFLAQNDSWIAKWGKMCVSSRYENKAVMIDLTALFAGVRDQYFGSQAKFDQTAYQRPTGVYDAYNLADPMVFPWGIEAKPDWAPVVTKVVDVPKPNWMIMHQQADAQIAIVSPDGFLRYYQFDGTPNGQIYVGKNPVHLNHDKGATGVDVQRANSGPLVTCREDRSITVFDSWGPNAKVILKIQDPELDDPVFAEATDMHGAETRSISVADFDGKAIRTYRGAPLKLTTQGGATFGMGADGNATFERCGSFTVPGKPFTLTGSNVN